MRGSIKDLIRPHRIRLSNCAGNTVRLRAFKLAFESLTSAGKLSKFQLAHKLHFAQIEDLRDNNPADLRLELELPIFLADFSGQWK